ncbi:hypothetical protein VP01_828g3 [Puccinia sorghi]|uniref:PRELI/MSF1 domain-containing protein n=1 Tax=Puccinia sorghi TaxID=27349 RepID=A0A0L6U9R3_9BASI|nr:hypothetical protein VP01_828g3 [Puccinia sorghi]
MGGDLQNRSSFSGWIECSICTCSGSRLRKSLRRGRPAAVDEIRTSSKLATTMVVFKAQHLFPFSFVSLTVNTNAWRNLMVSETLLQRDVAIGIWHKYPNEHSSHITSVDVLDRTFLPDGTLRTERLIAIRQHAPLSLGSHFIFLWSPWLDLMELKLVGGAEEQYVREVIFYKTPSSVNPSPMILMGSVNLSMSSILVCREKIRYQPSGPQATSFFQRADIQAQGTLAIGESWGILGSKLESWSCDRFSTNAESGRLGFNTVLTRLYQNSGRGQESRGYSEGAQHRSPTAPSSTGVAKETEKKALPADPSSTSMRLA